MNPGLEGTNVAGAILHRCNSALCVVDRDHKRGLWRSGSFNQAELTLCILHLHPKGNKTFVEHICSENRRLFLSQCIKMIWNTKINTLSPYYT